MQVLWNLEEGFLKDIVEAMPNPKPHSNTVATLLKIMVDKQFVATETYGRMHLYKPLITKEDYFKSTVSGLVKGYFGGNFTKAVSFLVEENKVSIEDLEVLLEQLKNK